MGVAPLESATPLLGNLRILLRGSGVAKALCISKNVADCGVAVADARGAGTTLKLVVKTSRGVQGNPYPKLKTPRIWPTIFFGRDPSSRTKAKKKNERH